MQKGEAPILGFRRRLLRLIAEQWRGKYTVFARRAGIPVSSMQHIIYDAKHIPGGEHLLLMAEHLGVSAHYLATGDEGILPIDPQTPPTPEVVAREVTPAPWNTTHIAIPMFCCACPGACPLTMEFPSMAARRSEVVLAKELLPMHQDHRLIALQVSEGLASGEWPVGARLVVDWDARTPAWESLALVHTAGRCALGHLSRIEDMLLFAHRVDDEFRVISAGEWTILGTIVAAVTRL